MLVKAELAKVWQAFKEAWSITISPRKQRQVLGTPLYANSVYLIANSAGSSFLGFFFWIVVARFYVVEDVGLGSALISVAGLLVFVSSLGLNVGLVRFLPGAGAASSRLINSCLTLAGLVALALTGLFLAGITFWSPTLSFVQKDPLFLAAFMALVVGATLFTLLSETFVALRQAKFTFIQGLILWLVRLGLGAGLAGMLGIFGIFVSWGLPAILVSATALLLFLPRLSPGYRFVPSLQKQVSNEMVHFSLVNYVSAGLWHAPYWLLPLMVVNLLGSQANAYFYIAWSMAGLLFAIPAAASLSLFAEGSYQEKFLARDVARSLKLIMVLLLPAMVALLAIGDKVLLVFGSEYSREGANLLRVLAPSALPVAVNLVYLGVARVRKRLKDIFLMTATIALGTLGLSYLLFPYLHLLAPGVAWLASQSLVAMIVLLRVLRSSRIASGSPVG